MISGFAFVFVTFLAIFFELIFPLSGSVIILIRVCVYCSRGQHSPMHCPKMGFIPRACGPPPLSGRVIILTTISKQIHQTKSLSENTKAGFKQCPLKGRMATELVYAAADGDEIMVEILLSQGARVDAREQGFTPLLVAAKYGHLQVGVGDKHRLMQCEQDTYYI